MKIEVTSHWRGVASDLRRVFPGVYDIDDPRLWGAGYAILEEGAAVIVEEDKPQVEPEPAPETLPVMHAEVEEKIVKPTGKKRR